MPEPGESDYEKQERWRKDSKRFIAAFLKYWLAWVSLTIGAPAAAFFGWRGYTIASWVLWFIAALGIVVAAFKTYRDEHRIAEANKAGVQSRLEKIQQDWLKNGKNRKFKGPLR